MLGTIEAAEVVKGCDAVTVKEIASRLIAPPVRGEFLFFGLNGLSHNKNGLCEPFLSHNPIDLLREGVGQVLCMYAGGVITKWNGLRVGLFINLKKRRKP